MSAKKLFLAVALVTGLIAGPAAAHEAARVAPLSFAFQVPGASVYYGAAPYVVPAPVYVARHYYGHPRHGHWQHNQHRRDHHAQFDRRFDGGYHRTAWR